MSILDDAIREHLELKRAHGADEGELKKLEDEAFGPPQRPDEIDPFAEAPTEFLASPGEIPADAAAIGNEAERSGRRPDIADLQEGPEPDEAGWLAADAPEAFLDADAPRADAPGPGAAETAPPAPRDEIAPPAAPTDAPPAEVEDERSPAPDAPPPSPVDGAGLPLPPPPGEPAAGLVPPPGEAPAPPAEEAAGTLFFDQESPIEELAAPLSNEALTLPTEEPAPATAASPAPPEEPAIDDEPAPPTDVAPEPAAGEEHPAGEHEIVPAVDHSTEERHAIADQPTQMFDVQAHVDAEAAADAPATEPYEQPPLESSGPDAEVIGRPPAEAEAEAEEGSAEFDFFNEQRLSDELDQALEAPLPPTDEHLAMPQYKDAPESEQGGIFDFQSGGETYEEDPSQEVLRRADEAEAAEEPAKDDEDDYDPETGHEDVLEDTPRFLEDAPEDDDLWFEQKPPKDFDLD